MKEKFKEISNQVNGTFNFSGKTIAVGAGVRDYQEIYSIDFEYKGELIKLRNYLGLKSYGTIESNLGYYNDRSNFTIETNSPLNRLFTFNSQIFKIFTKDKLLKDEIAASQDFKSLMDLAERTAFQPYVKGHLIGNRFNIKTEYHLLFPERKEILVPLIEFHKFLIKTLL